MTKRYTRTSTKKCCVLNVMYFYGLQTLSYFSFESRYLQKFFKSKFLWNIRSAKHMTSSYVTSLDNSGNEKRNFMGVCQGRHCLLHLTATHLIAMYTFNSFFSLLSSINITKTLLSCTCISSHVFLDLRHSSLNYVTAPLFPERF